MVNELRVVGPTWQKELHNGKLRWIANGCSTPMGVLAGAGVVDLRVVEVRPSCWMGQAFAWPNSKHRWDELKTVTVLPSRVKHVGWWKPEPAMKAMEDLLHDRPEAESLHVRVEPPPPPAIQSPTRTAAPTRGRLP